MSSIDNQNNQNDNAINNINNSTSIFNSNNNNINNNINNNNNASDIISNQIINLINKDDIVNIVELQTDILKKQYETNSMLNHFNEYSSQKYSQLSNDFEKHTKMLKEMKKDLDYIFKKTRYLQNILNEKFPQASINQYDNEEEED